MSVDVVIPLGSGSKANDLELRFALRSLEKHFLDLGRVFICGCRPAWLQGIEHVDVPDLHTSDKDRNLVEKVLAVCKSGVSKLFLRQSDDQVMLVPCRTEDVKAYHAGDLADRVGNKAYWEGGWKLRLRATGHWLRVRGFPTLHYDTHLPMIYDRDRFVQIMQDFPRQYYESDRPRKGKWATLPKHLGFTINTMYCNQAAVNPAHLGREKLSLGKGSMNWNVPKLHRKIAGRKYLGYDDAGFTPALQQVLYELFPTPSRFEKP